MDSERRMLLERIESLEQSLPFAGAMEAMTRRLLKVEQQCLVMSAHPLDAAAADAAGGSPALIQRLEALESTCKALQLRHNLGKSLEAASTQQEFSQLRSSMEVLQEFVQTSLAEERAERTKALYEAKVEERVERKRGLHEAKLHADEGFQTVDCRLAKLVGSCISDVQTNSSVNDRDYARRVGELEAELRAETANRVRTLTMELRTEILGQVAVREGKLDARLKLLETRLTGDLKRKSTELGTRIDQTEDEVKRNSKMVVELEERTAEVIAVQATEMDNRGAFLKKEAKQRGGHSLLHNFSMVTTQQDSDASTAESVRALSTQLRATPCGVCRRICAESDESGSTLTRMLAQRVSRQTSGSMVGNASTPVGELSTMVASPRISTMEVPLNPKPSARSVPIGQNMASMVDGASGPRISTMEVQPHPGPMPPAMLSARSSPTGQSIGSAVCSALGPRISTLEVDPTHTGRMSAVIPSVRCTPTGSPCACFRPMSRGC